MAKFERTNDSFIEKKIREQVKLPKRGVVKQVYEHADVGDDSNFEVDVELPDQVKPERKVTVSSLAGDSITVPKKGDEVLVIYTDGRNNDPVVVGYVSTAEDRAETGLAGMYRNQFESGNTVAGDGNLNITGYTSYDKKVSSNDKSDLTPEETFVQIAKHTDDQNIDPSQSEDIPAKVEFYDSAKSGESRISVKINKVNGSDNSVSWGMELNIETGEFKLCDPHGFGIKSDGFGNLQMDYKSLDKNKFLTGDGNIEIS